MFYPDLIDKSVTPDFEIKPIPEEPGFAILRFKAGPPYEDIAFKVGSAIYAVSESLLHREYSVHWTLFALLSSVEWQLQRTPITFFVRNDLKCQTSLSHYRNGVRSAKSI